MSLRCLIFSHTEPCSYGTRRPARRAGVRARSVPRPGEPHSPGPLLSASGLDRGRRAAELSPARRLASRSATQHTRPGWDLLFISVNYEHLRSQHSFIIVAAHIKNTKTEN